MKWRKPVEHDLRDPQQIKAQFFKPCLFAIAEITLTKFIDEDATKAAAVATKKSDWSKVRTYRLSTHTPPKFKLRT
jgi:dethiobiotin synthetase